MWAQSVQSRKLSLHEYQSQQMLKDAGLPVARGTIARTPEEAQIIARTFFDLMGMQYSSSKFLLIFTNGGRYLLASLAHRLSHSCLVSRRLLAPFEPPSPDSYFARLNFLNHNVFDI